MDILLIVASLAGIGLYMNNETQRQPKQSTQLRREGLTNNKQTLDATTFHPYEQNQYKIMKQNEQRAADELYEKSKNPTKTGVIPPLFNTMDSVDTPKKKADGGSQAETLEPEAVADAGTNYSDVNEDYEYINTNASFKHLNQVPFFRGSQPKQNVTDGAFSSRLERFTGQTTGDEAGMYKQKKEIASFAEIQKNPNINGAPAMSEESIQRYKDLAIDTKQGQALTPLGYVSQNTRGFRETPKTVDELRSKLPDRQKLDGTVKEVYGKGSIISQGPVIPTFQQNHTPREAINDFRSAVPSSNTPSQSIYANVVVPPNARSINAIQGDSYIGSAISAVANYITKDVYNTIVTGRSQIGKTEYAGAGVARDQRQTQYNLAPERTTIKQTTQTDYTPQISVATGGAYKILPQKAHATIRQQTTSEYIAAPAPAANANSQDRANIYASEINALRSIGNVAYTTPGGTEQAYNDIGDQRDTSLRGVSDTQEFIIPSKNGSNNYIMGEAAHVGPKNKDKSVIDRMNIGTFIEQQQAQNPLSRSNTKNVDVL